MVITENFEGLKKVMCIPELNTYCYIIENDLSSSEDIVIDIVDEGFVGLVKVFGSIKTKGSLTSKINTLDVEGEVNVNGELKAAHIRCDSSIEVAGNVNVLGNIRASNIKIKGNLNAGKILVKNDGNSYKSVGNLECKKSITAKQIEVDDSIKVDWDIKVLSNELSIYGEPMLSAGCITSGHDIHCDQCIEVKRYIKAQNNIECKKINAGWEINAGGCIKVTDGGIISGRNITAGDSIESTEGISAGCTIKAKSFIRSKGRIFAGISIYNNFYSEYGKTIECTEIEGEVCYGDVVIVKPQPKKTVMTIAEIEEKLGIENLEIADKSSKKSDTQKTTEIKRNVVPKSSKKGGRKTTDPSIKALTAALFKAFNKAAKEVGEDEISSEEEMIKMLKNGSGEYNLMDVFWAFMGNGKIKKDLSKIEFDCENLFFDDSESSDTGLRTLNNGLSVLQCYAGGDWEAPVFFIIYFDGKELRAYIPTEGNLFNADTKTAFGNDEEADMEYLNKIGHNIEDVGDVYNIIPDLEFDIEKIKEDIINRIQIV